MTTKWLASLMVAALASVASAQTETAVPLTVDQWQKNSCGAVTAGADGLLVAGTDARSGNGAVSRMLFDFRGGTDTYLRFMALESGYAAFSAGLQGLGFVQLTTDHSWQGTTVIPKNTWVHVRVRVNADRTVREVVSTGDYDTRGGSVLLDATHTLGDAQWQKAAMSQLFVVLWDNYAGTSTRLLLAEARTTAVPVTVALGESLTFDFADGVIPPAFGFSGSAWSGSDGTLSLTTSGNQVSRAWLLPVGAQLVSYRVRVEINQRSWGWDSDFGFGAADRSGGQFDGGLTVWLTRPGNACWVEQTHVLPPGVGPQYLQWTYLEDNRYSGTPSPIPHRVALDDVTITCPAGQRPEVTATNEIVCANSNRAPTVAAALPALTAAEGQTATNDLAVADADGDAVAVTASAGAVAALPGGGWRWSMPAVDGPASQEITVTAADGRGGTATARFTVTITNVAPTVGAISLAPAKAIPVGATVTLSAPFADPGVLDTHGATWDLGDGGAVAGAVAEADGAGTTTVTHVYAAPGVYTVTCTVTDRDGGAGSATLASEIVVYDPRAGTVAGAGALAGKARFAFAAAYLPWWQVPIGFVELSVHGPGPSFFGVHLDWLVVSGSWIHVRGTGWLDGTPGHGFQLVAEDGHPDRLRIQIWDEATGAVEYDSQPGAPDADETAAPLRHGSIEIHRPQHHGS